MDLHLLFSTTVLNRMESVDEACIFERLWKRKEMSVKIQNVCLLRQAKLLSEFVYLSRQSCCLSLFT